MLGLASRSLARPSRLISLPRHSFFPFKARTMANVPSDYVCRVLHSRQPVGPSLELGGCYSPVRAVQPLSCTLVFRMQHSSVSFRTMRLSNSLQNFLSESFHSALLKKFSPYRTRICISHWQKLILLSKTSLTRRHGASTLVSS